MAENLINKWEKVNFDSFFDVLPSKKYQVQRQDYLSNGDIPVVDQGQSLIAGYTNDKSKIFNHDKVIIFGDHTRVVKYVDFKFAVGADGTKILGVKQNINLKFAYYQLLNKKIPDTGYNRHFKYVKAGYYYIPPTLEEQQEIVDVLDAASEIIRLRSACIESAQSLIPTLFLEMFGDMSKNINNYELFKIKNLGKVTTGSTPSSKKENMFGGTIPFITPADLESGQDEYGRYVTQEGAQNSRIVRAGSSLVCCIGATIGKVDKAIVDSCFNQQINAIEWNEGINDIFGLYLFRQIAPLIRNKASHTTLPILNKGNFENIIIPKPPKPKQDLFAEKAQEIEAYIKSQQAELDNAKAMFQSLLHHSFTGELTHHKFGGDANG